MPEKYLSSTEVCHLLGISRTTLLRYRHNCFTFPKPVVLTPTTLRWSRDAVEAWAEVRAARFSTIKNFANR